VGRVIWYSGRVSSFGRRRRVGAFVRVGIHLVGACLTSDFDVVFTSGFVSSSSTHWYGQNTILTTFIFEQKIKHHFTPKALIPIVGDSAPPCGMVVFMIIAQRRLSTLTQYLTWFGKSPTSTGVVYIIRDRERIQHTKEDHIHSTPISHCYIGQQLHIAAGLLVAALLFLSLFFSLLFLLFLTLSFCAALLVSIYRLQ